MDECIQQVLDHTNPGNLPKPLGLPAQCGGLSPSNGAWTLLHACRMSRGDMAKPLLGHRSMEGDPSSMPAAGRTIGVLGSGDFARSLAIRLVCSGFKVVVGSRNPKRKASLFPSAAEVTFQAEAVKKTDIIFVAVFREHYSTLCDLADVLVGKILVDVSNNTEINHHKESNAEYLASLFPACTVVKGFNVVSAWTLQSGARDGNKQVLICSNNQEAKRTVAEIAQVMGFTPVDMGCMSSACEIENIPLRLLPAWKIPIFLALGLFLCFFTYNLIRQVIHPYIREQKNKLYKIPIEVVNTTLPCVAYVMLSLVYLPGVLAACSQLYYGTKYRRFPDWLDQWLQHRKQIGLLSFFCAALHAVYSFCLPMRRSHRYQLIETAVKQSTLGFIALVISTLHTLTYGWSRAFDENQYKFYLPPTYTLTLLVPCTVILAKVIFSLPCVQQRLLRIRRGWEKGRYVKFVLPSATGEYSSGETSSNV
ncbi:metalloreductase STEAP3 isoform X4 [Falco biarmicus]|uniref:metalloreductase STEAP3 isoform X4 n=1 Tax=Falco peregrinus TaxID=8954 RepID=UPI000FFC6848|nr:metalloreductase STEAP3 isoform X4 [Falco peregrinus]XP_014138968.2 metalloreductase STEAP3 isoform X4 [Falco cherrug]XP_037252191.1 metalloreductase STEAP3 isoform X4 [Falco rusticolus]XP_056204432.1 metalloreductase STEAP3 isoform X4 [Falco biarmicus]